MLGYIKIEDYSGHYTDAGVRLFMHMWMKEGFDSHRALALKDEMKVSLYFLSTGLSMPLIHRNYMEPVWAVLDKASPDQIQGFMDSRNVRYICSVLNKRGDQDTLDKFLSYGKSALEELESSSTNLSEVKLSEVYGTKQPPEFK